MRVLTRARRSPWKGHEMDNDQERDTQEEQYWKNHCSECDCSPCTCASEEKSFFCVAIYLHDKEFGGPEEGGWWYSTYEPVKSYAHMTRVYKTHNEAVLYQFKLKKEIILLGLNDDRRSVDSVLSDGEVVAYITENEYPCHLPKERPYYE
jgi:hypothetical protein